MKIIIAFITLFFLTIAFAKSESVNVKIQKSNFIKDINELNNRKSALISKTTHKRLNRIHNYMSKEKFKEALAMIERLQKTTAKRKFEYAQVMQTKGFVYAQMSKYDKSIKVFYKVMELNTLPKSPTLSTLYTISQLEIGRERYKKALSILNEWFSYTERPNAKAYVLRATAYAELQDKRKALSDIDKAISLTNEPKQQWLQFSVALNYELKNYKAAARVLEILTYRFPEEKRNWKQLSGIYINLNNYRKALSTLELAHKYGHLTEEKEYLNLASLYSYNGYPHRGAKILDEAIKKGKVRREKKSLELLAQSWIQSEEIDQALAPMQKAATLSKDGKLYARTGQLFLEKESWEKAINNLSLALKKGKLSKPENAYLALGIAKYNIKNYNGALKDLQKAQKIAKNKRPATQWINHIETEIEQSKQSSGITKK